MGRPLPKRFFGNVNTGSASTTADDGIGGQGIASINWSTLGSFQGNSNVQVLTALTALPAPTLPNGVQATYTAQFEVESVGTGSGKTNLAVGDTFGVASIPGMIAKVTDTSGANAVWSVTTTGASRGNALALAAIPQDTVGITLTKIAGSGTAATFFCDIAFRVKESTVTITEPGSGYVGTETFTFTKPGTTSGTVPAGTIVLTVPDGVPYDANAFLTIKCTAQTTNAGSPLSGDIVSQRGNRRYKVKTTDGTAVCNLVAATPSAAGDMTITATDATGGTYYVTKIGAHRCTVVQNNGTAFDDDSSVPWTFTSPAPSGHVTIANA